MTDKRAIAYSEREREPVANVNVSSRSLKTSSCTKQQQCSHLDDMLSITDVRNANMPATQQTVQCTSNGSYQAQAMDHTRHKQWYGTSNGMAQAMVWHKQWIIPGTSNGSYQVQAMDHTRHKQWIIPGTSNGSYQAQAMASYQAQAMDHTRNLLWKMLQQRTWTVLNLRHAPSITVTPTTTSSHSHSASVSTHHLNGHYPASISTHHLNGHWPASISMHHLNGHYLEEPALTWFFCPCSWTEHRFEID